MLTKNPVIWKLLLWTGALVFMCALDADAVVTGLMQAVPSLAVPATALGLSLITAANRDRQ